MEIAACIVLVRTRVVVHHVQASMGNYLLLRLLSKEMKKFLEVLLVSADCFSEPLSDTIELHKTTKAGVTICLVTINCPSSTVRYALDRLHQQFTSLFWPHAFGGSRGMNQEHEYEVEEDLSCLSPANIEHILSCSPEVLINCDGDVKSLLRTQDRRGQPAAVVTVAPVIVHEDEDAPAPAKMRDTFWLEEKGVPKIRIADVQLYFGAILSAAIKTFNTEQGAGFPGARELSLPTLAACLNSKGETYLRDVEIPKAVSTLLLQPEQLSGVEGKVASKSIEKELRESDEAKKRVNKFLILGGGKAGRNTLLKQMKIIYGTGFAEEERKMYLGEVLSTIFQDLASVVPDINDETVTREISSFCNLVGLIEHQCWGSQWNNKLKAVLQLWSDNGVFRAMFTALTDIKRVTKTSFNLLWYWLPRVNEIVKEGYIPNDQDILHSRSSCPGVNSLDFSIDGNEFQFITPKQRNERKKWIHCFEDVTAIIFMADVSSFNQTLYEDENMNALQETQNLFDEVMNSRWFRYTSMILFVNGRDVLLEQLKRDPNAVTRFFPDILASGYEQVVEAFNRSFQDLNRDNQKNIYSHITCAVDTTNIGYVMSACKDIVIRQSLSCAGLCGGGGFSSYSYSPPSKPTSTVTTPAYKEPKEKVRKPKGKKDKADKVDNVFADMENVFNGLAETVLWFETSPRSEHTHTPCLCFYHWDRTKALRWIFVTVPSLLVLYCFISAFAISILLPCVFWLLIVKTTKVERKVETGFAVRQEVLAKETCQQKACRVVTLLRRSIPMICLLVVWPLVIVLVILPSHPNLAQPLIGSQLVFIALLQCLGCVRSMTAWMQANTERQQLSSSQQLDALQAKAEQAERCLSKMTSFSSVSRSTQALVPPTSIQEKSDLENSKDPSSKSAKSKTSPVEESIDTPSLVFRRPGTWIALIGLAIEAVQLACVALPSEDISLSSVLLVQPMDFVPPTFRSPVQVGSSLVACAGVLALILLFCLQLLKEVRIFGKLKQAGKQEAANKFFFHSFVGTILYGHGEMKGVSCFVSMAAALLSDSLFLIICTNLLRAMVCVDSAQCWQGSHSRLAALSLVALSFYVPLCAMIGPLLSEARDGPAKPGEIQTAQPFLSVVTVSKFLLLLLVQFFAGNSPQASPIASFIVCSLMFAGMVAWTARSGSLLITTVFSPINGLLLPLSPPAISIWKTLSFASGIWGGAMSIVFSILLVDGSITYRTSLIVLGVGLGVLFIFGVVWHRTWSLKEREVRRSLIALALLLQGSEEVDLDIFYRAQIGDARMGERVRQKQDTKLPRLKSTRSLMMINSDGTKNTTYLPPPLTGVEIDPDTLQWNVVTL